MSESKIAERETTELIPSPLDPALTEDQALALLKRPDLHPEVLEQLAKNANALKSRKVKVALVSHPKTPRHISVPLARQFYAFDLMKVTLFPSVPADVKVAVENILTSRLKEVTLGERLTLARRASGRVAAALMDLEPEGSKSLEPKAVARSLRLLQTALDNAQLTEDLVIHSVTRPIAAASLAQAVAQHPKWSRRKEIRAALLRTEHLSLVRALEFSRELPTERLEELIANSRLPSKIKELLLRESEIAARS